MKMTQDQLWKALKCSEAIAQRWTPALTNAMQRYGIDTPLRIAHFLAQVGHESNGLTAVVENLNYSAQGLANTWPSRFALDPSTVPYQPNGKALMIARQPEKIANCVYANRMGNGDEESGDGWKYKGRGCIQTTGHDNYEDTGKAIGVDLLAKPDALEIERYAAMAAGWFWNTKGLNQLADANDIGTITRRINGGLNGLDDRKLRYDRAIKVFS